MTEQAKQPDEAQRKVVLQAGVRVRITTSIPLEGGKSYQGRIGTLVAVHDIHTAPYEVAFRTGLNQYFEWHELEPYIPEQQRGGHA